MRKYIQRVLAFLLVLCLVGAEVPASVFAAPAASSSVTQSTTNSTENSATSSAPVVQDSSVAPIALSNPSGVKVVYNVYKGRTYTEPLKDITYDKTNGFWAYAGNKNIGDAKTYKEEFRKVIGELKKMKEVMNKSVFKGRWKLVRLLIK